MGPTTPGGLELLGLGLSFSMDLGRCPVGPEESYWPHCMLSIVLAFGIQQ